MLGRPIVFQPRLIQPNRPIWTLKRSDPHSHLVDSYTSLLGSEHLRKWLKHVETTVTSLSCYVTSHSAAAGLDKFWLVVWEPLFLFYSHAIDQVPRVLSRIVPLPPQNQTLASSPMTDPWCCYIWCAMDPINIPPMLAYIPAPWILWVCLDSVDWNMFWARPAVESCSPANLVGLSDLLMRRTPQQSTTPLSIKTSVKNIYIILDNYRKL